MDEKKIQFLEKEERVLARVLLKNDLISEEALDRYLEFKGHLEQIGKEFLGAILLRKGYIKEGDLSEFVKEQEGPYLEILESMAKEGFITNEQLVIIKTLNKEEGKDILSLLNDLDIMTKDNFVKIFNKKAGGLRFGEWLVFRNKVTPEQIEEARSIQKVTHFEEFLTANDYCSESVIEKVKGKISSLT